MTDQVIFHQYVDGNSILIVTSQGIIKRLYVPFRVKCNSAIGHIPKGAWVYVDEVGSTNKDQLLFYIHRRRFEHFYFSILIDF